MARKSRGPAASSKSTAKRAAAPRLKKAPPAREVIVLVSTRKGAWLFHSDAARRSWRVNGPHLRLDRPSTTWERIGRAMPAKVGDIGFTMTVSPWDADTAWVFPMDGSTVWPRTAPDGRPAVYGTRNAGKSWKRLAKGLPEKQAWWTVKRQAMTCDWRDPVGLYFGTTSGELWMSRNEGEAWSLLARHLPEIYAVETTLRH